MSWGWNRRSKSGAQEPTVIQAHRDPGIHQIHRGINQSLIISGLRETLSCKSIGPRAPVVAIRQFWPLDKVRGGKQVVVKTREAEPSAFHHPAVRFPFLESDDRCSLSDHDLHNCGQESNDDHDNPHNAPMDPAAQPRAKIFTPSQAKPSD